MIQADFLVNSGGELMGFQVEGHSDYSVSGSDIVCSAVSSAAYMAANTIIGVLSVVPITVTADDGYMLLKVAARDASTCKDILQGFKIHLINLEEQYNDYLKVGYMEV